MPVEQNTLITGPRQADVQKGHEIRVSRAKASFAVDLHTNARKCTHLLCSGVSQRTALLLTLSAHQVRALH